MAGKQILGDDPFASGDASAPPPAAPAAGDATVAPTATDSVPANAVPKTARSKGGNKKSAKSNSGSNPSKTPRAAASKPANAAAAGSTPPVDKVATVRTQMDEPVQTRSDDIGHAIADEGATLGEDSERGDGDNSLDTDGVDMLDTQDGQEADDLDAAPPAEAFDESGLDADHPGMASEATAPLATAFADSNSGSNGAGASETYSSTESRPPSEYGPSIDRTPSTGHRHGLVDEVRHIEKSVRNRFQPARVAEHNGERQKHPLEFVWQRWRKLAMRDRSDVVDEFGRDPKVAAKVDPLLDFLYRTYFRVETRGLGHIPDEGRALIVANHSGTLPYDGAMIMHAVRSEHRARREVRPLVEDFVFHFPYLGTLMNRIGGVRACPENAERLLQQDQLVAVFPEGIKGIGKLYRERYQLQRFGRGGFIKLALKSDAPIIPTAVVGAEEIHPMVSKITWLAKSIGIPYIPVTPTFPALGPLGLIPLPTKWFIAFGEPLYFNAEYGADGANDRILVNKLAEQVRIRIQEMLDSLLKQRRSILFG